MSWKALVVFMFVALFYHSNGLMASDTGPQSSHWMQSCVLKLKQIYESVRVPASEILDNRISKLSESTPFLEPLDKAAKWEEIFQRAVKLKTPIEVYRLDRKDYQFRRQTLSVPEIRAFLLQPLHPGSYVKWNPKTYDAEFKLRDLFPVGISEEARSQISAAEYLLDTTADMHHGLRAVRQTFVIGRGTMIDFETGEVHRSMREAYGDMSRQVDDLLFSRLKLIINSEEFRKAHEKTFYIHESNSYALSAWRNFIEEIAEAARSLKRSLRYVKQVRLLLQKADAIEPALNPDKVLGSETP